MNRFYDQLVGVQVMLRAFLCTLAMTRKGSNQRWPVTTAFPDQDGGAAYMNYVGFSKII